MNTATQTAPATVEADRFRCEADVPDPPPDAAGRKQYWEDTVAEAVAELRRRLASTRDEKSFQALQMIVDLEKTRLRHKEPVAGTQVAQAGGGRWADGLEPLPVYDAESDRAFALRKVEPKTEDPTPPATLTIPQRVEAEVIGDATRLADSETPAPTRRVGLRQNDDAPLNTPSPERGGGRGVGSSTVEPPLPSYPYPPKPLRPIPMRERLKLQQLHKGVICHFHDHDDDYLLERRARRRRLDLRDEEPERIDLEAVRRSLPPPPVPRVRNLDLFSLRDEAPALSGRAVSP